MEGALRGDELPAAIAGDELLRAAARDFVDTEVVTLGQGLSLMPTDQFFDAAM
ncbi:hypothetical protein SAV14893_096740 [Streptomyces avermitilis]|uniref:Uncharacterized protein n=2 Tax=Streptomyces avermitilis TaxID=33903 RepID=A0A143T2G4_STRAW|nr:hypothetical protein SAVERM_2p169 [Streptomyces avermitilis MA-4680 = NBRC 14893]GDY70281.1 hypothetical protein SAV14893_096740 [Streptomyces avermitilis]GDY80590.1 hypothetical protein SAV31267_100750 [Streptomyces avermitilis]